MLQFKLRGVRVGVSIWFSAFFAFAVTLTDSPALLYCVFAMLCHEMGHFLMMWTVGAPVKGFYLLMGRLVIVPARGIGIKTGELAVLLGGVAANMLCALLFASAGNRTACLINLFIAAYNALPAGELDGGAALRHMLNRKLPPKRADTICLVVSVAVSLVLVTAGILILLRGYPYAAMLFAGIYLLAQNIKNVQYTN